MLAIFVSLFAPMSTYAKVEDYIDKFAANNIMFYDPDACGPEDCSQMAAGAYSGDGSDVTWIGDSISEMSKDVIKQKIPQVDLHAKVSKHFWMDASDSAGGDSGLTILEGLSKNNQVRKVLIFALGTNDPNAVTTEHIKKVLTLASSADRIVFTTNHTTNGNYDDNNKNFKSIADSESKVALADWKAVVDGKESEYLGDGVHPKDQKAMETFVDTILGVAGGSKVSKTEIDKGEALANHSTVTFYSSDASENGGNAGRNASEKYNDGKLADGQIAINQHDPDLSLGDVVYIETEKSGEGSAAHEHFYLVTDTGAGDGGVSGNYNIDVFHDPASENTSSPYGMSKNAKIYKIKSGVSWEDYLSKYKDGTADIAEFCEGNSRGQAVIKGSTAKEKVWSGLTSIGFTEEQAAGIMGNMQNESGFNPVRHEISQHDAYWPYDIEHATDHPYGIGLIQWSNGRRVNFLGYIKQQAPDLMHYFLEPEKYDVSGGDNFIKAADSETDVNDLMSLSVTFLYDEVSSSYSSFLSVDKDVRQAALRWSVDVEGCTQCTESSGETAARISNAEAIYKELHGKAITGGGGTTGSGGKNNAATTASAGENKDYAGNPVFTDEQWAKVQEYQPLYEEASKKQGDNIPWAVLAAIHVRESNLSRTNPNSDGIFQILALDVPAGHENTDAEFVEQAVAALDEFSGHLGGKDASDDDNIKYAFFGYNGRAGVYKTQARDLGFTEEEAENGEGSPYVMNRADAKRDPTVEPTKSNGTWGQIKVDYGPIEYPANSDYGAYIYYVAAGGGSFSNDKGECGSSNSKGNMDVNQTAIDLAWPVGDPHVGTMTPKPEYEAAYKEVSPEWTWIPSGGSSCDFFVATVMRYSGVDLDFACCGTENQRDYMRAHPELYEEIPNTGDPSILRPGDILQVDGVPGVYGGHGHIKLYVEIDGVGHEAQASYNRHSGELSTSVNLSDPRGDYKIFRHK